MQREHKCRLRYLIKLRLLTDFVSKRLVCFTVLNKLSEIFHLSSQLAAVLFGVPFALRRVEEAVAGRAKVKVVGAEVNALLIRDDLVLCPSI